MDSMPEPAVEPGIKNSLARALEGRKLVLASSSPRRIEFFEKLGVPFAVRGGDVDESYPDTLVTGEEIVKFLSRVKACAAGLEEVTEIVVGADTIVWAEGRALGKPKDKHDAMDILRMLSGRTHRVITGVTIRDARREETFSCTTEVTFDPMGEDDIRYYVELFRPMDKAGAYAIQQWIGETHITSINGSYHNVVGLPTAQLYDRLKKFAALR